MWWWLYLQRPCPLHVFPYFSGPTQNVSIWCPAIFLGHLWTARTNRTDSAFETVIKCKDGPVQDMIIQGVPDKMKAGWRQEGREIWACVWMSKWHYWPNALDNHPADSVRRGSERQRGHDEIGLQSNRLFAKKLLRNVNQPAMPWSAGGVSSPAQNEWSEKPKINTLYSTEKGFFKGKSKINTI